MLDEQQQQQEEQALEQEQVKEKNGQHLASALRLLNEEVGGGRCGSTRVLMVLCTGRILHRR